MDRYTGQLVASSKRVLLYMSILLLAGSGWAYVSGDRKTVMGLLIGLSIGGIYILLMTYRIYRAAQLPKLRAVTYMRTGWWLRLSFMILALTIVTRFAEVNFWAVILGLLAQHLVLFFNAVAMAFSGLWNKDNVRKG